MMGNKKTAICPYAVTQDVFLESDNIPTSGQRIYNMTTGQWYTGDGVTELRNLTPSITNENGEVDLSNYYTKTESDDMLNSVFQGMDTRDEINLGLAKQYTNNSITEATNQLEPFFCKYNNK